MFQYTLAIVFAVLFHQINGSPFNLGADSDEARDLLIKIKNETNQAAQEYDDKIQFWILEADQSQATFLDTTIKKLETIANETSEKIKDLIKEAEDKGPDGLVCITSAENSLSTARLRANSYITCAGNQLFDAANAIMERQRQVQGIVGEIGDLEEEFVKCGEDEDCFQQLIPVLQENLKKLPERIQEQIQLMDEYINEMSTDGLGKNCDTSQSFSGNCSLIMYALKDCIRDA